MQDYLGRDSDLFWLVWAAEEEKVLEYFARNPDAPVDVEARKHSNHRVLDFACYNGVTVDVLKNPHDPIEVSTKLIELRNKRKALGEIVKILLSRGANPLHTDTMDRYAIFIAANSGNIWTLKALTAPGVKRPDAKAVDKQHRNILHAICSSALDHSSKTRGKELILALELIINNFYANPTLLTEALLQKDIYGLTPLMLAKYYGYTEIFEGLYGARAEEELARTPGIDKDHPGVIFDYQGRDQLIRSSFFNEYEQAKAALEAGADPLTPNPQFGFRNSLHLANHGAGDPNMVKLLLAYTEHPEATDHFGGTVLHWNAYSGRIDTLRVLLTNANLRAHINDQDDLGGTALHAASMAKLTLRSETRPQAIALLIENGIDTTIRNNDGLTAIEFAESRGNILVADAIRFAATQAPAHQLKRIRTRT